METAKIFKSGNSQTVRFDVTEVQIFRRGDEVVLKRKPRNLEKAFELLTQMSNDFIAEGRCQPSVQEREPLR